MDTPDIIAKKKLIGELETAVICARANLRDLRKARMKAEIELEAMELDRYIAERRYRANKTSPK